MADPSVARRIRLRRQALRLTQQQLADELGVHRSTVSAWERGTQAPERYEGAIEAVLGISLSGEPEDRTDPVEQQMRDLEALIAKVRAYPSRRSA